MLPLFCFCNNCVKTYVYIITNHFLYFSPTSISNKPESSAYFIRSSSKYHNLPPCIRYSTLIPPHDNNSRPWAVIALRHPASAGETCTSYVKIEQLFWIFFQVPLTLSPVTGRRLDYTIFSVGFGVTDGTKNSRLFAITPTTCSTLILAVCVLNCFFHPSTSSKHY